MHQGLLWGPMWTGPRSVDFSFITADNVHQAKIEQQFVTKYAQLILKDFHQTLMMTSAEVILQQQTVIRFGFFFFLGFRPSPWWSQYIMNCYCLLHAFYFNRASNFVSLNSIACMCFIIIFIKHVDDVNRCLEAAEWISQGTLFQLLG